MLWTPDPIPVRATSVPDGRTPIKLMDEDLQTEPGIDPRHAALLFSAPIFYQHLFNTEGAGATWITAHIDNTVARFTSP